MNLNTQKKKSTPLRQTTFMRYYRKEIIFFIQKSKEKKIYIERKREREKINKPTNKLFV